MAIQGVSIAFADAWDEADPTWTQIDTGTADYQVLGWTIDRGRQSELDKTSTGVAQIRLVDYSGDFDPTYPGGAYYGYLDPMKQVAIALQNPTDSSWNTVYRGFVSKWSWEIDQTTRFLFVTIDCVDGLEVLASHEVIPSVHGTTVPSGSEGEVYYEIGSLEDGVDMQVEDRINAALDDAGWPSALRRIFSGNIAVQPAIYAVRSPLLTVIDDAADAEFPGVAVRFVDKEGNFVFHGRQPRFRPDVVQYDIDTWKAGDDAACASDSTRAPLSPPFVFINDVNDIVNAVYAAPQGIADTEIAGQYFTNTTSQATYGTRSLSFENLLTEQGYLTSPDTTDLEETSLYASYYLDNKADPRVRVPQLTFKGHDKNSPYGANIWSLLCGIDISDIIDLDLSTNWGGGFVEEFFVEGLHYECSPGSDRQPDVTLTVDISPKAYYDTSEWE